MNSQDEEALRGNMRELREQRDFAGQLIQNEGFQFFVNMLEDQIRQRRDRFELVPVEGIDSLVAREFERGELAGLRFAAVFMAKQHESAEEGLTLCKEQLALMDAENAPEGEE